MQNSPRPIGPIFEPDPVNRDHPLNQGRLAWWLAMPHLMGGPKWYDLMGLYHGTLSGMSTTSGWRATTRPGGSGHMLFTGSPNIVTVPSSPGLMPAAGIALAAWVNPPANPTQDSEIVKKDQSYLLRFYSNGALSAAVWRPSLTLIQTTAGDVTPNAWSRVMLTNTGTSLLVFVNGKQVFSATTGGGSLGTSTNAIGIGGSPAGGEYLTASVDDVTIWAPNPAWTSSPAAFAALDYSQSRQGYPDALNRR